MEKKRKVLSFAEKLKIIEMYDESVSAGKKQCDIAKSLGLPDSSLRTILSKRKTIEDAAREFGVKRRKFRTGQYDELEEILVQWFNQARATNIPVNGPILQAQALKIAEELKIENFKAASGWLHRFRQRHGIVYCKIAGEAKAEGEETVDSWVSNVLPAGEAKAVDEQTADSRVSDVLPAGEAKVVGEETVDLWVSDVLPNLLSGFSPENVFSADECALFFKLMPDSSLAYKNENCHNGKLSKDRLTVLLCTNASGTEKLKPLVIGKSKKPRCFENVKSFPCDYDAQKNAWMTAERFKLWVQGMNDEMRRQERRVLLFVDNCPAHPKDLNFSNVQVQFLPSNCTSVLQPLDQGIIKITKQKYRRRVIERYLAGANSKENFEINLLDSLHYLTSAWDAVSQKTIQHCFQKAGFFADVESVATAELEIDEDLKWLQSICLETYYLVDEHVPTCEEQSHDHIIENFQEAPNQNSDDDEHECMQKVPTKIECLKAVQTIRQYFSSFENIPEDIFRCLNQTENALHRYDNTRQTKILDFFKKKL